MKKNLLAILTATTLAHATESKLWHEKPATLWEQEALPIGNGRLGAMIFGGVERKRIQFNEDSLWIGDETDTGACQAFGDLFIDFDTKGTATLHNLKGNPCSVKINGTTKIIRSAKGETTKLL